MRQATNWTPLALALLALAALSGCTTVERSIASPAPAADAADAPDPRWDFGQDRPAADRDGYRPPRRLAVLLPMTGQLAIAASPVRDGLLAGYYAERRERPELVFYDTQGTAGGAVAARDRAVSEGADQILGPLGRDEVSALFSSRQPVPTLALNRGNAPPAENGAYFSLAPEHEGTALAEYLLARNARRILVLHNGDDHAQRALAVFREKLEAAGGSIVATVVSAGDTPVDHSAQLQAAATGAGGVDAVLIGLRGNEARVLLPQLAAAGLGGRLRVATSQLASGTGKPEEDSALDGIVFAGETWTTRGYAGLPSPAALPRDLRTARGPAARLFAFGYDAWQLSGYLQHLSRQPGNAIEGATGRLHMDATGHVLRHPTWASFSQGVVIAAPDRGG